MPRLGLDTLVVNYARAANLDLIGGFAAAMALYVLDTEGGVLAAKGGNSARAMAAYVRGSGYADILSGSSSGATGCMPRSTTTMRCARSISICPDVLFRLAAPNGAPFSTASVVDIYWSTPTFRW